MQAQQTVLVLAALAVAAAGVAGWGLTRRRPLTAAQRRLAAHVLVVAAGAGVVGLLLLAGGDRPEPFLPLAAAVLCGVAPLPRLGVRVTVQVGVAAAVAAALIQAGRPTPDIVLPLGLLAGVALVANALALHLAAVRNAGARARRDGRRRGDLLAAVRVLAGADPGTAAAVACDALRRHGFAAAVVARREDELVVLHTSGEVDTSLLVPADGPVAATVDSGRTHVLDAPHRDDPRPRPDGTGVIVPIMADDQPTGALVAITTSAAAPTPAMLEGAEVMASHLGVVLATAARVGRQRDLLARMSQLDRMRSAFVAEVSAELRPPLTAVRGIGQTLVSHDPDLGGKRRRELLERVADQTDRLRATIDALLDFSRFQAGRPPPVVGSVTMLDLLRPVAATTGARLEGAGQRRVEVDAALVRHALELLLGGQGRGAGCVLRMRSAAPAGVELVDRDGQDVAVSGIVRSLAAQLLVMGGGQLQSARRVVLSADAEATA